MAAFSASYPAWTPIVAGSLAILGLAIAVRIFQQFTAWTIGIDGSSRDVGLYYRSLFIAEVVGVTAGTLVWWG